MVNLGLWKKEIFMGRLKFFIALAILSITAVGIPFVYKFTLKMVETAPVPEFARSQVALFKDYSFYIWSQWFGKNLLQMGSMMAIFFGAGVISSEVSAGTINFLLTKPVRRQWVFTVKYVTGLAYLVLVVVISTMAMYFSVVASGRGFPFIILLENTGITLAGLAVVFSLATYFSTIFDQATKSMLVSALTAFGLSLPGYFPAVKKYSLYYQMQGSSIYAGQGFPVVSFIFLVLVSAGIFGLAAARFSRKDL